MFARYGLGLGTPPLSIADPEVEYMFAPDQEVMRFGNRFSTNGIGMRSPGLDQVGDRTFVLALGDSVLNGGNLTDQGELATTLSSDGDVFYGNASAGSWGIPNMLAWYRKFEPAGVDKLVIVYSSHDALDVPTFEPLDPGTHPTASPASALWEGATRYLPRYLPDLAGEEEEAASPHAPGAATHLAKDVLSAMAGLRDLAAQEGLPVCVVHHWTQHEIDTGEEAGGAEMGSAWQNLGVPLIEDQSVFAPAGAGAYRDDIHLSAEGQRLLSAQIETCAREAVVPD